jgi:hypothetical protein
VLRHRYRRGKQLSRCGLVAYRPGQDEREEPATWMGFELLEGAYDTCQCIRVLDGLGSQLGHQPVTVIWDNLGAITPATWWTGRPPSHGWWWSTCRRMRRSWTRWRGCGPT